MKLLLSILGGVIEWVFSLLWLPVHLRNYLHSRALAAQAQARVAIAQEMQANALVMNTLWAMGSDFKPLARLIATNLHAAYGVQPSTVAPGTLVPLERNKS